MHGATGGVGLAAVQVARAVGATVIASGGDDEKLAAVVAACGGAIATVNYSTTPRFRDAVKAATAGRGVDVIYDPVGGERGTAFPCTSAAVTPKTDAFACGAAAGAVFDESMRCGAYGACLGRNSRTVVKGGER